ncbi:MAG TPA: hydroxymethylbilane synthase [Chthoniobacteraceae bacterium]|jgi:hydroxymethylbilane synthase|nr:hydroxymethylbilane synthase [Chthoniobacteraceae bacterium]
MVAAVNSYCTLGRPQPVLSRTLVIGTRGSALALAQVELLREAFRAAGVEIELKVKKITTSGDRRSRFEDVRESGAGVKGLFTKEIEQALLDGEIDVAVHSCKDLPGRTSEGLAVRAVLEREETGDVFIGRKQEFASLPEGAIIATGSVRRRRQLAWLRPGLVIDELRGNVPTRIEKLRVSKRWAGIALARAGLKRLGIDLSPFHISRLPILPAIGQGAIALQCREQDCESASILAFVNHEPTFLCIRAERELLRLLNGDCHLPVAGAALMDDDALSMRAVIFDEEGAPPRSAHASSSADDPEGLAAEIFEQLSE